MSDFIAIPKESGLDTESIYHCHSEHSEESPPLTE
jgi:hypothetical protein